MTNFESRASQNRSTNPHPSRGNGVIAGPCSSNHESRITNHGRYGRSGRSGPPLCGGTPPATPPCSYATVRARPQLVCQRPGDDATVRARFQPVVNAPRTRCVLVCPSAIPPFEFRVSAVSDHYPLSAIHCPLSTALPKSGPAVPCKSLRNVLYCKVESEHNQAGPERAVSHNCPPTMPRPPTMSTCSEPSVPILPQANFAPGSVGNNSKCTDLPSVEPPTHSVMTPAMQPMPAPPAPGSVSCHEKHAAVAVLRTFCTQNDIFCANLRQKRPRNADIRFLLRESLPISCHEKRRKNSQNRPKLVKTGHSIPYRCPADTRFPKNSQPLYDTIRRSWANSGQNRPHSCLHVRLSRQGD